MQDEDIDDFVQEYAEGILFNQEFVEDILEENYSINLKRDIIDSIIVRIKEIFEYILLKIKSTNEEYLLPTGFNEFIRYNEIKINEDRS